MYLPVWETPVRSLGRESSLEEERATYSSILVWKVPRAKEPGRLQSMESQREGQDRMSTHAHPVCIYGAFLAALW